MIASILDIIKTVLGLISPTARAARKRAKIEETYAEQKEEIDEAINRGGDLSLCVDDTLGHSRDRLLPPAEGADH